MKRRISVAMAVYNQAKYLPEAIESILSQSLGDFEFIIVDDGSTDDSGLYLKSVRDNRVRVITHDQNLGLAASLNEILRQANGEFFARMDADDISEPERLELQVNYFQRHPYVDVVGSSYWKIDPAGLIRGFVPFFEHDAQIKRHLSLEPREAFMSHPALLIRKKALLSVGGYSETYRLSQDKDLLIRMARRGFIFANMRKPMIRKRKYPGEVDSPVFVEHADQHNRWRERVHMKHKSDLAKIKEKYLGIDLPKSPFDEDHYVRAGYARLYRKFANLLQNEKSQLACDAYQESLRWDPSQHNVYLKYIDLNPLTKHNRVIRRLLRTRFIRKILTHLWGKPSRGRDEAVRGKLKIAFVSNEFVTEGDHWSGLAQYVHRVGKSLVRAGCEVHLLTPTAKPNSKFEFDGITIHGIPPFKPKAFQRRILIKTGLYGFVLRLHFNWYVWSKLRELHRRKPFSIFQFTNVCASGLLASVCLRVPYTVRVSSVRQEWHRWSRVPFLEKILNEWMETLFLRKSRYIYTPSEKLKSTLTKRYAIRHVRVIRSPIYLELRHWKENGWKMLENHKYLIYFGGFKSSKGFTILAQALPQFLEKNPDRYAVLIGKDRTDEIAPSMSQYAQSICKAYSDRLVIMGPVPHEKLYPLVQGARLVVLPSVVDNLPNTCLEAMALEKPVLGTRGSSLDELLLDNETGFLTEPGRVDALANRIEEAWSHPNLEAIGKKAKEQIQDLSPEKTIPELLSYYDEIRSSFRI